MASGCDKLYTGGTQMKLRNKKTGKIHEITEVVGLHDMDKKFVIYSQTEGHNYAYKNLSELSEDWEDYEEPEPTIYYYISDFGAIREGDVGKFVEDEIVRKEIGNYFETKEEAEKVVEKLKAWKRLKDKGFRFNGGDDACISYLLYPIKWDDELEKDFDLLFGGK